MKKQILLDSLKNVAIENAMLDKKQEQIKERKETLKREKAGIAKDFIERALGKFIERISANPGGYITYNDSCDFTAYVNRNNIHTSPEHSDAIDAFNKARKNLATIFVNDIIDNTHNCRQRIIDNAGIKNLNK